MALPDICIYGRCKAGWVSIFCSPTAAARPPPGRAAAAARPVAAELGACGERAGQLHLPRQPASSRLVIDLMAGTRSVARAAARASLVARSWELVCL